MNNTKEPVNIQVTPYDAQISGSVPQYSALPQQFQSYPKKNSRAYRDIAIACIIISLPLVVLSGVLLGLIYTNQVVQSSSTSSTFQLANATQYDASAYFVDFSATRLITIASWTSSVAPLLPGFVMSLLSFPAARRMLKTSQAGQTQRLPTPYQLALYLTLMTGGWTALWQWLKYRFWGTRERQAPVITRLVIGLISATLVG